MKLSLFASTLACLALCACAGDPELQGGPRHGPERGDRGPGDEAAGREPRLSFNIFISPMGEPFRAGRHAPYPVSVWFNGADADHDGKLTEPEFAVDAIRVFHILDANHDGVIDGFEISDYEQKIAPEILPRLSPLRAGEGMDMSLGAPNRRGRRPGGGEGEGRGPREARAGDLDRQGAGPFAILPDPEPVSSASSQLNNRVTLEDWKAAVHRRFERLDLTRRGWLSLTDLPKTPIQRMIERRQKPQQPAPDHPGKPPQD
jgi:hypothetical protein